MNSPMARTVRGAFTLADAWREFCRHPSPWMIGATLVMALTARMVVGDWQITDALVPAVMPAVFPFFEWKPRTPFYRAIWRNHRLHHFKNEHYWFTITSSGTADRVLRTHPDPATVPTSLTAKNLHAGPGSDAPQNRQRQERLRHNSGERRRNRPRRRGTRTRAQRFVFRVLAFLRAGLRIKKTPDHRDHILRYVRASIAFTHLGTGRGEGVRNVLPLRRGKRGYAEGLCR
jgi:hypothetical protein